MEKPPNPAGSVAKAGIALKAVRRRHGWTLAEVSRRTGLSIATLSKIENDKMSPTFDKLVRISTGLHVDIPGVFRSAGGPHTKSPARLSGVDQRPHLSASWRDLAGLMRV